MKNKTRIDKEGYILYSLAARCFSTFPRAEFHRLWYARQGERKGAVQDEYDTHTWMFQMGGRFISPWTCVCVQQELLSPPRSAREKISRHATLAAASLAKNSQGVAATVEQERSNKTHTHTGKCLSFYLIFLYFLLKNSLACQLPLGPAEGTNHGQPLFILFFFCAGLSGRENGLYNTRDSPLTAGAWVVLLLISLLHGGFKNSGGCWFIKAWVSLEFRKSRARKNAQRKVDRKNIAGRRRRRSSFSAH